MGSFCKQWHVEAQWRILKQTLAISVCHCVSAQKLQLPSPQCRFTAGNVQTTFTSVRKTFVNVKVKSLKFWTVHARDGRDARLTFALGLKWTFISWVSWNLKVGLQIIWEELPQEHINKAVANFTKRYILPIGLFCLFCNFYMCISWFFVFYGK